MNTRSVLSLLGCILLCQAAGLLGAISTSSGPDSWYATLDKPPFNPPSWAFGVVWPILYTLMGIALWLVWRKGTGLASVRTALAVFFAQLLVNAVWSPVFFGLRSIVGGFVIILILIGLILATIRVFRPISDAAAWLLVPYLAWTCFAALLNGSILWLNGA